MNTIKPLTCIVFAFSYASASVIYTHEAHTTSSDPTYRLPETLAPTNYDLSFTFDPEKTDYTGNVSITFDVAENTSSVNEIYLHADKAFLLITSATLDEEDCTVGDPNDAGILSIDCSRDITGKNNVLYMTFTGIFSTEDGFGLVKTSYVDQGTEQVLIESNFKPTYARRAFPCMDEPEMKASFSVAITYPQEYTVISNSPASAERSGNGLKTTEFEATPRISTYLVSIFLSKLKEASASSGDGYQIKIITRAGVVNMTSRVAGNYTGKLIEQLGKYTGVSYKNLNDSEAYQLAVPNQISDTMGEFGLFTYRESDLLDEGDKTTARAKQNIIMAMAYKLSHEWYGGDVSTKWWSDVWANEAVATYFKYIIPDQISDEFELTNQFMVEVIQKALQHDALPLAQPLSSNESEINSFRDIENKLDTFNYLKGASILHMIKYVVRGEDNLKAALQYHWQQRQDSDTDGQDILLDLVKSQDEVAYYPFLETWAFSPGFPLLSLKLKNSSDDRVDITKLSQKRFVYPVDDAPDYRKDKWDIPLTCTSQGEKNFDRGIDGFYEPDQDTMYFGGSNIWLMFNLQGGSFYRVNYEDQLWRRIIGSLKSDERNDIHFLNKARLVDDIFNIARIGDVSYSLAFELADFLVEETEYYPWYSAFSAFSYILGKLEDDGAEANFKKYILNLMDRQVHIPSTVSLETDGLPHVDVLKQVMMLTWACDLGHFGCTAYAILKFENFKEYQASLDDYNYRGLIFCNGLRYSENIQEDWDYLWNLYSTSTSVHEQNDVLNGLGCAERQDLLASYLNKTVSPNSGIDRQDALAVFKSVLSSSVGLDAAMDFLTNFETTACLYLGVDIYSEMLYAVAEKMLTDEHLEWIKGFVNSSILDGYEDVRSKAVTLVSVNNYWKHHYQNEVRNIFPASSTTTTTTTPTIETSTITEGTSSTDFSTISTTTEGSSEKVFLSNFIIFLALLVLRM